MQDLGKSSKNLGGNPKCVPGAPTLNPWGRGTPAARLRALILGTARALCAELGDKRGAEELTAWLAELPEPANDPVVAEKLAVVAARVAGRADRQAQALGGEASGQCRFCSGDVEPILPSDMG